MQACGMSLVFCPSTSSAALLRSNTKPAAGAARQRPVSVAALIRAPSSRLRALTVAMSAAVESRSVTGRMNELKQSNRRAPGRPDTAVWPTCRLLGVRPRRCQLNSTTARRLASPMRAEWEASAPELLPPLLPASPPLPATPAPPTPRPRPARRTPAGSRLCPSSLPATRTRPRPSRLCGRSTRRAPMLLSWACPTRTRWPTAPPSRRPPRARSSRVPPSTRRAPQGPRRRWLAGRRTAHQLGPPAG
jgi:hypothetical protein